MTVWSGDDRKEEWSPALVCLVMGSSYFNDLLEPSALFGMLEYCLSIPDETLVANDMEEGSPAVRIPFTAKSSNVISTTFVQD